MKYKTNIYRSVSYLILCIVTVIMLFPFVYMFVTACKDDAQLIQKSFFPSPWHLENFYKAWTKEPFTTFLFNSTGVAVITMILAVLLSAMGGFALSKYRFRGRNLLFTSIIATMMVPGQVTMIPNFLISARLGILDSYIGLIVPVLPLAFGIFMMRQFIQAVPDSLIESARVDGATEFGM
ncbi:carbohydrate ABC transporter permease, partial [Candidatus Sumerlaeota bacterium]|nr:carbohydrate ABC transporter permease [Candidatus Sumerlaeota bacterium]